MVDFSTEKCDTRYHRKILFQDDRVEALEYQIKHDLQISHIFDQDEPPCLC